MFCDHFRRPAFSRFVTIFLRIFHFAYVAARFFADSALFYLIFFLKGHFSSIWVFCLKDWTFPFPLIYHKPWREAKKEVPGARLRSITNFLSKTGKFQGAVVIKGLYQRRTDFCFFEFFDLNRLTGHIWRVSDQKNEKMKFHPELINPFITTTPENARSGQLAVLRASF